MRRALWSLLGALLTSAGLSGQPTVTVTTFDLTSMPAGALRKAQAEASRILLDAGIRLEWLDCELAGQAVHLSACAVALGPDRLMLQFIPGSHPTNRRASGMAAIQKSASVYACVYPERIRELSLEANWEFADLLGHAVAHELGHLLLDSAAHSTAGIMRARWEADDLRKLSHVGLVFLSGQLDSAQLRFRSDSGRSNPKKRAVASSAAGRTSSGARR